MDWKQQRRRMWRRMVGGRSIVCNLGFCLSVSAAPKGRPPCPLPSRSPVAPSPSLPKRCRRDRRHATHTQRTVADPFDAARKRTDASPSSSPSWLVSQCDTARTGCAPYCGCPARQHGRRTTSCQHVVPSSAAGQQELRKAARHRHLPARAEAARRRRKDHRPASGAVPRTSRCRT
jgi:hypothetical protein